MKRLLFITFVIVLFGCSSTNTTVQEKEIPVEVSKLAKNNSFDTLTVVNTTDKIYVFEKGEYKNTVNKTNDESMAFVYGLLIGLFAMCVLIIIIA